MIFFIYGLCFYIGLSALEEKKKKTYFCQLLESLGYSREQELFVVIEKAEDIQCRSRIVQELV